MTTVAIVCEYNPFHNGHLYQIEAIRREFGEETRIIAVMSGNYTQRGECAILDKLERAKCAVLAGVNLVLELPFPFSMSSAEFFSRAAINIVNEIGIVDYLSFGSESGDINSLTRYAELTLSDGYTKILSALFSSDEYASMGYPELCQLAYEKYSGEKAPVSLTPNNILAVEYIKELIKTKSRVKPHTVKRIGASYDEARIIENDIQSASGIRNAIINGTHSAPDYVPDITKGVYSDALSNGDFPCLATALSTAIISHFRINSSDAGEPIHDARGGLYNRLKASAIEANDLETLISLTETKKYTRARIRRAVWYSFFGVTSSDVVIPPTYSQVLAMDGTGRSCLKEIGKQTDFPIITKPSNTKMLDDVGRKQKELADKADSVFQLTKPTPKSGAFSLTFTPFVKK